MDSVTDAQGVDIDWLLERVEADWEEVPTVLADWSTWEWVDAVVFVEEWPLVERRMERLHEAAAHGVMIPAQQQRYARVLELAARYRPLVRQLEVPDHRAQSDA